MSKCERVMDGSTGVVYEHTGEFRVPKEDEDYLIAEGVVGTACPELHTKREVILCRVTEQAA